MQLDDQHWLRRAFTLAEAARARGDAPFGAVLVDAAGNRLLEAGNTVASDLDPTAHAETNLVRLIRGQIEPETLAGATMYASTEPCAMCAGALYWSGIGRLVFGLSNARLYAEVAPEAAAEGLRLSSREVLAKGGRTIAVIGPLLEDEAAAVVRGP